LDILVVERASITVQGFLIDQVQASSLVDDQEADRFQIKPAPDLYWRKKTSSDGGGICHMSNYHAKLKFPGESRIALH